MRRLLFVLAIVFMLAALVCIAISILFMSGNNLYLQGGLFCCTASSVCTMIHTRMKKDT